ncbi:S8 family serine peptidase [Hyalangium versicolor]|uniref:S8 family serine peptidase n=1 Tax=Hyalangium versicolor TaxID=2861190 RepID=UPI001CCC8394|nr:S8 family serine peptidase [Hyalangium versicolor]
MTESVRRLPRFGLGTKGARALGLVGMLSLLGCEGSGNSEQQTVTVRAQQTHKVQLSAEQAKQLEEKGITPQLVADYGSFKLVEVDDKTLAALPQGAETRDNLNDILLNAGTLDTASAHGQSLRGMSLPATGKALKLVQFAGPIKEQWVKDLEATGVKIIAYVPNNAYIVQGDATALNKLQRHATAVPTLQWSGDYLNDYKLDPSIQTNRTPAFSIQLVKDDEANNATLELIRGRQSRGGTIREGFGYVNVVAYLTVQDLYEIAARPDVLSIQPRSEPRKYDERQNMIISGHLNGNVPTGPGWLAWLAEKGFTQAQFTASGFGVDVSDSGMDNGTTSPNHFGFYTGGNISNPSRIVYNRIEGSAGGSTVACDGHGNLNAHIIGGYTNLTGAPFQDAEGYSYGLGVAPFVKLGGSVIFGPDWTDAVYEDLQSRAYRDGMRISSNSWGYTSGNTYNVDCQQYDRLVRDAQNSGFAEPNVPGNQEMVIVFAAGNDGPTANTVAPPGTAKNIITVGASENVQAFGGADACGTTDAEANSGNDMATFSSRGPSSDGRKKPEIVAPGTHVSGGVGQDASQKANPPANPLGKAISCFDASGVCAGAGSDFFPSNQQWYTASSGTSHSTPAVAGAAALVRQYFINQGITPPSAAMTKAYLMSTAHYMTGTGANDNLWSNSQGMGLLDLGVAFDGTPRTLDDQNPSNLFTATGQTRTFEGVIADSTKPFRVTLAWTDAPGSTTGGAWNNNLDLTVTVGSNTYKGNVFTAGNSVTGGTADDKNNAESVFLPAGTTGNFTVTVTATNITSDGVPGNASALDQDFALVAYNTCNELGETPTGVSATDLGDNHVQIQWSDNGSAKYAIYRSTTAGGPYTRLKTVEGVTEYVDQDVSRGITYYYVVRGVDCAESANSVEVSATATGVCKLTPTFAGLTSAANGTASTCSNTLTWADGTAVCGGTLTYSVYRDTTAGFTPSLANKIATGISGTTFNDDLNLTNGTKYYYVVRATETSDATNEESNKVEKSAAPTGAMTAGVNYFDDLDSNRPANAASYWIPTTQSGTSGTINLTTNCHYQSATKSYRFGAANATCGGVYPISTQATLSLGGDGTTAGINGFTFPASTLNPTLTFNLWYNLENRYDGAYLVYSTTAANGPWTQVPDAVSTTAPYISAGGYDNTLSSNTSIRIWTNTNLGTNGSLKAVTVNLSALAGKKAWFGFKFYSDSIYTYEGLYLDDVRITANAYDTCTTNTPPPGPAASYRITNLPATVGAGDAATFDITAYDALGQVAASYTGSATFTSSDPQAQLPSATPFTGGVATGVPVSFRTLGKQTITASDSTNPGITGSGSTNITAGAPVELSIVTQPSDEKAGHAISPAVTVGMKDQFGNPVSTGTNAITVALGNNAGGGTLAGTTTVSAVNGVASFANLSLDKVGTGYTLVFSADGLTGATSQAFDITPDDPAKMGFLVQPSTTKAGDAITPAVQVIILDQFDNTTDAAVDVTLGTDSNPGNSRLEGTTTVTAVNGVATFSDLSLNKVGTGYTLVANADGLDTATSDAFNITPADPYRVIITTQPSSATANTAIAPAVKATVLDRFENVATQATDPVTASLGNNRTGAKLQGNTSVNPVSGVATFSDLKINKAGQSYTLVVAAKGLFTETSVAFDITGGASSDVNKLAFKPAADKVAAGEALTIEVELQDADGNVITDATAPVTLSLGEAPEGGQLFGTTTVAAVSGVAKFTNLSAHKAGGGYTLVANASGFTGTTSAAFAVTPGAAASFTVALPASVTAGEEISVSATAHDAYGNTAASYAGPADVTSSDASASFSPTATFVEGVLSNFKVTFKTHGLKTLSFKDKTTATLTSTSQTNVTAFAQPTVSITDPAGGKAVTGKVSITAEGAVAAGTTLAKLTILVDGAEIASGAENKVTGSWDSDSAQGGTHVITAVITDGAGNSVTSAPVIVSTEIDSGCGCGATSGTDASIYLGLLVLARYALGRRRKAA